MSSKDFQTEHHKKVAGQWTTFITDKTADKTVPPTLSTVLKSALKVISMPNKKHDFQSRMRVMFGRKVISNRAAQREAVFILSDTLTELLAVLPRESLERIQTNRLRRAFEVQSALGEPHSGNQLLAQLRSRSKEELLTGSVLPHFRHLEKQVSSDT